MRTGVLPFRAYDNDQSSGLDMSAMGGSGGQKTPNRLPVLVAAGTDEMRFERDFVQLPPSHNRPALGGQSVEPAAYHKDRGVRIYGRADHWSARDRDRTALSFLPGCAP